MNLDIPSTSRRGARVLLFGPSGRVLLLHASVDEYEFWLCPGGGVEEGETWEQAAIREAYEETGLSVSVGSLLWFRRHVYSDATGDFDLFDLFFLGRSESENVSPRQQDHCVHGHRWWTVEELVNASDEFAPRRLKELIVPISRGQLPEQPFDCGI